MYEKYNRYKDSGVEWLGMVPEHWEVQKLKHFLVINKGRNPKEMTTNSDFLPYLTMDILRDKSSNINYVENSDGLLMVREGDILVLWDGANAGEIIKAKDGYLSSTMAVLKPKNKKFRKPYLYYLLKSKERSLKDFAGGTTIPHLDPQSLIYSPVSIPPLSDQTAIANFLDKKASQIDHAIELKKKTIALLKEQKQILIQELVTGKKVWDKTQNCWTKPTEVKDSGVEWIGEIPKDWEVMRLKYTANIVLGKMICNTNQGGMVLKPYLKSKNIQWLRVDISSVDKMWFTKEEMNLYRLKKDDIILSEGGEVGKTCIWNNELEECYIQNSAHKVTVNTNNNSQYLLYLFFYIGKQGVFDSIVNKVSIAHLTKDKLSNFIVCQPPLQNQNDIVYHIEQQSAKIDRAIALQEQKIEKLNELKATLIDSAVTGKIKVSEV